MAKREFRFINAGAKRAFKALPAEIQRQFGLDLQAVADGQKPFSNFKDISSSVGAGAIELIENGSPAYRAVYCAKYLNILYVLHAFEKTCEGVDKKAMDTAEARYKMMKKEIAAAEKLAKKLAKGGEKSKPKKKQK